jgi:saccharopine dehydrogenase-like NADP-dependent oxidoreductase
MYLALMKSILVLGAGRSSSSLIKRLLDRAEECQWRVVVGDIDGDVASSKVGGHPFGEAFQLSASDNIERDDRIAKADIVMSMVPAFLHVSVAKVDIASVVPVITPSYVSEEMQALDAKAKEAGVLVLNEIGLDPGIDHMSAMKVIDKIKKEGGKIIGFESYCGGLVAPDSDDNPWHYKISWNPRNIVLAGQGGPATFQNNGRVKIVPPNRVFKRLKYIEVDGRRYQGYPNRDSLSYMKTYGLEDVDVLIRGTLRGDGYCESWNVLVQLGMISDDVNLNWKEGISWSDWTRSFLPATTAGMGVKEGVRSILDLSNEVVDRLEWLGIFNSDEGPKITSGTPADIIQTLIEEKWKLKSGDRDMIVMWHRFEFEKDGKRQEITSEFAIEGTDLIYTAMSDTVGFPMALAAEHILEGPGFGTTGVEIPVTAVYYEPILAELEKLGVTFIEKHKYV